MSAEWFAMLVGALGWILFGAVFAYSAWERHRVRRSSRIWSARAAYYDRSRRAHEHRDRRRRWERFYAQPEDHDEHDAMVE